MALVIAIIVPSTSADDDICKFGSASYRQD